jgi:antitoxin component YwqK of YwqJK toxin-antitoxin module
MICANDVILSVNAINAMNNAMEIVAEAPEAPLCGVCYVSERNLLKCYCDCSFNTCLECYVLLGEGEEEEEETKCPQCKQGFHEYIYPGDCDEMQFRGNMINRLPNDPDGTMFYVNDTVFSFRGPIKDGKIDGPGYVQFNNNQVARNVKFDEKRQIQGEIVIYKCDSSDSDIKFKGRFKDGAREHGTEYTRRLKYVGDFKDDQYSGYGTLYSKDGVKIYTGHWVEGEYHGEGMEYDKTDTLSFIGEFDSGCRSGKGKIYSILGDSILGVKFSGVFKDGVPVSGEYTDISMRYLNISTEDHSEMYVLTNNKGVHVFKGTFDDDLKRTGVCVEYDDNGLVTFEGVYCNDVKMVGVEYTKCGVLNVRKYKGEYYNEVYHGFGETFKPDGKVAYTGHFVNGVAHGLGTLVCENEMECTGEFLCDNLVDVTIVSNGRSLVVKCTDDGYVDSIGNIFGTNNVISYDLKLSVEDVDSDIVKILDLANNLGIMFSPKFLEDGEVDESPTSGDLELNSGFGDHIETIKEWNDITQFALPF